MSENDWLEQYRARRPGKGRPRGFESQDRVRELLRLLASGRDLRDAAREARVDPDRVLALYADPGFRSVASALLDDRISLSRHSPG